MILLPGFATLKAYLRAAKKKAIPRPSRCVVCGYERVWFIGWYQRHVNLLMEGGGRHRERIKVRRGRCAKCYQSFGLLPAFVYPHRQFGLETTERTLSKLFRDRAVRASDFAAAEDLGPSERTVRRWVGWTAKSFDEGALHSELLSLQPTFPVGEIEPVRVRGGEKKEKALGGRPRARRAGRILAYVRAWHQAGRTHRRTSDRWALRSYLRHLWHSESGLVVYLTRPPAAPKNFYPSDAK